MYLYTYCLCKGAGLIGGPGLVPGCTIGREYALFELVKQKSGDVKQLLTSRQGCRQVGLELQNKNVANPTAMLLSAVMMLRHLNLNEYADKISNAVHCTIEAGKVSVCYFYIKSHCYLTCCNR